MTPQEIQTAARLLQSEIGPKAQAFANVAEVDPPVRISIYPSGILDRARDSFSVYADDWQEGFDLARARWSDMSQEFDRRAVRSMALAIIRITADMGACSDAALRADGFAQAEIDRHGAAACADADAIAGNGPFAINVIASANAA